MNTPPACPEWEERIAAWADGELEARRKRKLRRHLEECVVCAAAAEAAKREVSALRSSLQPVRMVGSVREEVLERVDATARHRATRVVSFRRLLFPAAAAAGVLLAVALRVASVKSPAERLAPVQPPAAPSRLVASLIHSTAPVEVAQEQTGPWQLARGRMAEGTWIRTRKGKCLLAFDDGTHVAMDADTVVGIDGYTTERSLRFDKGRAFCSVEKGDHPWRLATAVAGISVLGTQFAVRSKPDTSIEVAVVEGTVAVRGGGPSQVVYKGYGVHAYPDRSVSEPMKVKLTSRIAWTLELSERAPLFVPRTAWVDGVVKELDTGKPLLNSHVYLAYRIEPNGQRTPLQSYREARTDEAGRFTLDDVAPGEYVAFAKIRGAKGGPVRTLRAAYGKGTDVVFRVDSEFLPYRRELGWIRGRLRDAQRRAIVNAQITANSGRGPTVRAVSDARGEFELPELAPGSYQIRVTWGQESPHQLAAKVKAGEETDLTIDVP